MKATKIHEFSNGGIVAKLGSRNVYMVPVNEDLYAVWNLPPWDNPESLNKENIEWTNSS